MDKRILFGLVLICLIQFGSADILINFQSQTYNLGDILSVPMTLKTSTELNGFLTSTLICGGQESEFYKEFIFLSAGEEKKVSPSILLSRSVVGVFSVDCVVKSTLNGEYVLSDAFFVTNQLYIEPKLRQTELCFLVELHG